MSRCAWCEFVDSLDMEGPISLYEQGGAEAFPHELQSDATELAGAAARIELAVAEHAAKHPGGVHFE